MENRALVDRIMDYEAGALDPEATVELFQQLVDTGLAWKLQGSYSRTAMALMEANMLKKPRRQ